jgi:biopolymer transport protein ExbB
VPEFGPLVDVRSFIERGGPVLPAIFLTTLVMWSMILERIWYYWRGHPAVAREARREWEARREHSSWYAQQIRRLLISQVQLRLDQGLTMIKTLVALCPLFGLLGTVTGMIDVFEVMAIAGTGNARAMAGGVSKATLPTFAGMVAAISGLLLATQLERYARNEAQRVADSLAVTDN